MSPISPFLLGGLAQASGNPERVRSGERTNPFTEYSGINNPFQSNSRQILSQMAPFNFSVRA